MEKVLVETVYKIERIETLVPDLTQLDNRRFPILKKAVYHRRGKPIAVLVGITVPTCVSGRLDISTGWAIFNHNDRRFNREIGKKIALARALDERVVVEIAPATKYQDAINIIIHGDDEVPERLKKAIAGFAKRCERYFKIETAGVVT